MSKRPTIASVKRYLNTHDVRGFDRNVCKATNDDARQFLDAATPDDIAAVIESEGR